MRGGYGYDMVGVLIDGACVTLRVGVGRTSAVDCCGVVTCVTGTARHRVYVLRDV